MKKKPYPGVYAAKALTAYADAIDLGLDADDLRMVRRVVAMAVRRLLDEGPLGDGWTAADVAAMATVAIGGWVNKLTSTSILRVSELRLWARTCRSEVRARTRAAEVGQRVVTVRLRDLRGTRCGEGEP